MGRVSVSADIGAENLTREQVPLDVAGRGGPGQRGKSNRWGPTLQRARPLRTAILARVVPAPRHDLFRNPLRLRYPRRRRRGSIDGLRPMRILSGPLQRARVMSFISRV